MADADITLNRAGRAGLHIVVDPWVADIPPAQATVTWEVRSNDEANLRLAIRPTNRRGPWPFSYIDGWQAAPRNTGHLNAGQLPQRGGSVRIRYEILIEGTWSDGTPVSVVLDPEMHIRR